MSEQAGTEVAVTLNGEPRRIPSGTSVAALLASLPGPRGPCAVEVNQAIVPRSIHAQHVLAEGDAIEIVGFVGGG